LSTLSIEEVSNRTYLTITFQYKAISVCSFDEEVVEMPDFYKYVETIDKSERSATLATLGFEQIQSSSTVLSSKRSLAEE